MKAVEHLSVLLEESVTAVLGDVNGVYLDGTFGRGGHSRKLLQQLSEQGKVFGLDRDPQAVSAGRELEEEETRFSMIYGAFGDIKEIAGRHDLLGQFDGILLDLGVSSPQLDQPERGFSFLRDGPLDMRMDPGSGVSAEEWVNTTSAEEMARVFKLYGEERFSKRIARAVVDARAENPITRTDQFAQIVKQANPSWERDKHPATRVFQAVRIEINEELSELEKFLDCSLQLLKPGGRMAIISFHSLEDRIVKRFLKQKARGEDFPKGLPVTQDMIRPTLKIIGKALKASDQEVGSNPRSRSAVLRVGEKITDC